MANYKDLSGYNTALQQLTDYQKKCVMALVKGIEKGLGKLSEHKGVRKARPNLKRMEG